MLISKTAIVKWNSKIKKHYVENGYLFTKMGDEFEVLLEHLTKGSKVIVELKCDYCGESIFRQWEVYNRVKRNDINNNLLKDCCSKTACVNEKTIESNRNNYNSDYPMQNKDFYENIYIKNLEENFGVINNFQREDVKQKIEEFYMENFGVSSVGQVPEIKQKQIDTVMLIYGVDNVFKSPEIVEKIRNTNLEKYGVEHLMQIPEVVENRMQKMIETKYRNNTGQSSRQQNYLCSLLEGELNYPIDRSMLDIAFVDEQIYVEYHGSGHWLSVQYGDCTLEEFNRKEMQRQYYLKNKGWKLIRIISTKDKLPSDMIIKSLIEECKDYLNNSHSWIEINIDESKLKCSQFERDINLGVMRKIKEEDLKNSSKSFCFE